MKKNILIKCLGLILMVALFASCKSKSAVVSKRKDIPNGALSNAQNALKSFEVNSLTYFTFSGKAKANISFLDKSHDVTANVRIQMGKAIWISVTALLGIEVARILITPDSIKILNKLESTCIIKPFNYIHTYVSEGVSFSILEDLLVGNISYSLFQVSSVQVVSSEDDMQLIGSKKGLKFRYSINKIQRPSSFKLLESESDQSMTAIYQKYLSVNGHDFPHLFSLEATGSAMQINAKMEYNKVIFNENVEMPFAVPSRYTVIN